jgi:hypothetical protein
MRNYREIGASKNYLGALGSGRSQIIAPVRDSMQLRVRSVIPFVRVEQVTNYIDDSIVLTITPVAKKFNLDETVTNYIDDSGELV